MLLCPLVSEPRRCNPPPTARPSGSGFYAELCDLGSTCPSRFAYLISAGVISFLLAAVALVGLLQQLEALVGLNVYICAFLALWWGVTAGVASSPRTFAGGSLNVGLLAVWLAFLASIAAFVGAAASAGWFMGTGGGGRGEAAGGGRTSDDEADEEEPAVEGDKPRAGSVSTDGGVEQMA